MPPPIALLGIHIDTYRRRYDLFAVYRLGQIFPWETNLIKQTDKGASPSQLANLKHTCVLLIYIASSVLWIEGGKGKCRTSVHCCQYPPLAILVNYILVLTCHCEKYSTFSPSQLKRSTTTLNLARALSSFCGLDIWAILMLIYLRPSCLAFTIGINLFSFLQILSSEIFVLCFLTSKWMSIRQSSVASYVLK